MSVRHSRGYSIFKTVNGLLFIGLGGVIVFKILAVAGADLKAIPGVILGAAMLALGIYRTALVLRARQ